MECKSGRHEWTAPLDAGRCCSAYWRREVRPRDEAGDLDPRGRIYGETGLVHGWVKTEAGREFDRAVAALAGYLNMGRE